MKPKRNKAPGSEYGKLFERAWHDAFRNQYLTHNVHWDRPVDSYEAGNMVRAQAADFVLTIATPSFGQPFVFYIECKASTRFASFSSSQAIKTVLADQSQIARMRKVMRAGAYGLYAYRPIGQAVGDVIELWDARHCAAHRTTPPKTPVKFTPVVTLPERDLPDFAEQVCSDPYFLSLSIKNNFDAVASLTEAT